MHTVGNSGDSSCSEKREAVLGYNLREPVGGLLTEAY